MARGETSKRRGSVGRAVALVWALLVAGAIGGRAEVRLPSFAGSPDPPSGESIPLCTAADLDATTQAVDSPNFWYTLAFNYRNTSGHDCRLEEPGPLNLGHQSFPGGRPVQLCPGCTEESANANSPGTPSSISILKNGEVVHVAYGWKTASPGSTKSCMQSESVSAFVNRGYKQPYGLVSNQLLRTVCPPVLVGNYVEGYFSSSALPANRIHVKLPSLKLLPNTGTYYPGEPIDVRATVLESAALVRSSAQSCPTLIQRTRTPDGMTRWDEFGSPGGATWCKVTATRREGAGREIAIRFDSGHNSRWGGLGNTSVSLLQVVGKDEEGNILMAESNTIQLHVANNMTMKRKWGPKVKGVAVNVTLDKHRYEVGRDIPLHVALENFSAKVPVLGLSTVWEPCQVVGVEVRDAREQAIKERFEGFLCTGNAQGYFPYKRGVVVPLEMTLKGLGLLPDKRGVYTVTVTWHPVTCAKAGCEQRRFPISPDMYRPYAVVRDTAAFEVVRGP